MKNKRRFLKWIYLAFSSLVTVFIIVQASLPASQSARWSNIFVRFFMNLFNGTGKDTTEVIDVTGLDLEYDSEYQFNYVEGYLENEIALGKEKRVKACIAPENATNSAVQFTVSDNSIAKVTQNLNFAYITGLKEGSVEVTATSLDNGAFIDKYTFNIVNKKAPVTYVVNNIDVYEGSDFYLPISYENDSFYNIDALSLTNSSPSIASKVEGIEGLYKANSLGTDTFITPSSSFTVNVISNSGVIYPHFSSISGKDTLTSKSTAVYEVEVDNSPTNKDVYWTVSNNALASISKDGTLKLNEIKEENKITITARSLLDDTLYISREITLKPVTITSFELVVPYYGTHITNMPYMGETGEEIKIWMEDNTGTIASSGVTVSSSDESVAEVYAQGSYIYINCIKEGDTKIVVTSINNPEVSKYIDLQVTIRGVINHDNYLSFSEFIRKSIGHFLLFFVDGVLTYLFLYELNKDVNYKRKKYWHHIVLAVIFGVLFAGLSELIQYFVPTRYGSFMDIGVDSLGYILGVAITVLVIYLIHCHQNKKKLETSKEGEEING